MPQIDEQSDEGLLAQYQSQSTTSPTAFCVGCLIVQVGCVVGVFFLGPLRGLGLLLGVIAILLCLEWSNRRAMVNSPIAHKLFERGYATSLRFEYLQKRIAGFVESGYGASYVIAMKGCALPHGGSISIYAVIDSQQMSTEFQIDRRNTTLDQELTSHLVSAIESFLGDPRTANRFPVHDGFPCDICVGSVARNVVASAVCNLCDPVQSLPILELCRHLQELAEPLCDEGSTMLVASCDKFGNIDIRKM